MPSPTPPAGLPAGLPRGPARPGPARPRLKAGLRRVWRGPQTLQLGVDPERAIVVEGVDEPLERFLLGLDGSRPATALTDWAREVGLAPDVATRLLHDLTEAGAVDDAAVTIDRWRTLDPADRDALAPELAALDVHHREAGAGARRLGRRLSSVVELRGSGQTVATLAQLLTTAGVGVVRRIDPVPADRSPLRPVLGAPGRGSIDSGALPTLAVLVGGPVRHDARALTAAGTPVLAVEADTTVGWIGPLVLPGRSSCVRCVDLARADRDPGWSLVLAQLVGAATEPPLSTLLSTALAVHAALHVTRWLDGDRPPSLDGVVELRLPEAAPLARRVPPHPACGCTWPPADDRATMTG